jgi:hypothetical protein
MAYQQPQLIINGTVYPVTSNDKYSAYDAELGESIRMASGKYVFEARGKYTKIEYSYDYFEPELMQICLNDLRSGKELEVAYLPDDGREMQTEKMRCTKLPQPTFAFGRGNTAYFHNVAFTLEGVDAHD